LFEFYFLKVYHWEEVKIFMSKVLEKVERRLEEKLFLKGERCAGPKCAAVRRNYPPGMHGKSSRQKRGLSEYGKLLRYKQIVRFFYGLDDRDIRRYTKKAASEPGVFSSNFLQILERRLDNVVFRLGFAESRAQARHLVSYGHILVNGKRVNIPSYQVKKGEVITLKKSSLSSPLFAELDSRIKKIEVPAWLELDKTTKTGRVVDLPETSELETQLDATKIKEFYSR